MLVGYHLDLVDMGTFLRAKDSNCALLIDNFGGFEFQSVQVA